MKANLIFFPGMIFHELSHLIACILFGVKVRKVKFLGFKEAYVVHEQPNALKSIGITLAPFILGNWVAFYFFAYSFELLFLSNFIGFIFLWLALSLALYSFPSDEDAKNTFTSFKRFYSVNLTKRNLFIKLILIISLPFVFVPLFIILGFMLIFNRSSSLRFLWLLSLFIFSFNQAYAFEFVNYLYSFLNP